jgi:hypothetical protein
VTLNRLPWLLDTGKWLWNHANDPFRTIENEVHKDFDAAMRELHELEESAKRGVKGVVGGGVAQTAMEGLLGVVVVGGVAYLMYEGYRYTRG